MSCLSHLSLFCSLSGVSTLEALMSRKTTLPTYAAPTELPPSVLAGAKGKQVTQVDVQNDPVFALAKKHWDTDNHKVKWNGKIVEEIAADYFGSTSWDGRKVMLLELLQFLEKVSVSFALQLILVNFISRDAFHL